jgi:hypothetical protein
MAPQSPSSPHTGTEKPLKKIPKLNFILCSSSYLILSVTSQSLWTVQFLVLLGPLLAKIRLFLGLLCENFCLGREHLRAPKTIDLICF